MPLAAAIDGVAITPRRLVTSTHSFGQAASTDRLRIVQVSDLHVHGIGTLERQLLEQLHESQADLIVITGDSIDRAESLPLLDRLLGEFPRSPRVLAILGNWEYRSGVGPDQFAHTYARHGIELLGVATILPPGCGRYVSGWYRDDGGPPLYVSRGIGTSLLPIRLGATPELVRIDWGLEDPLQFSAA